MWAGDQYLRAKKVLSDVSLPPLPFSLENWGAEGAGQERCRHSPGFGWRYSIVLVNTSVTALLVRSTFCRKDKTIQMISSGLQQGHRGVIWAILDVSFVPYSPFPFP